MPKFNIESREMQSIYYDSMNDAAGFMENGMHTKGLEHWGGRPDWAGGTASDCIYMLRNGNADAMKKYSKLDASLPDNILPAPAMQQDIYYDVAGASVDIGAYMTGAPECMLEFTHRENYRFVDIYVCCGYSGGTDHDTIIYKYMYITKLIDLLESTGYRCALHIGDVSESDCHTISSAWVALKNHSEKLDILSLLCTASPMFLRIMLLASTDHLINVYGLRGYRDGGDCVCYDRSHTDTPPSLPSDALYISSLYSAFDKNFTYRADLSNFDQFAKHYLSQLPDNE